MVARNADPGRIARGNSKSRKRKAPVDGRTTEIQADEGVAEAQKDANQERLAECTGRVAQLDGYLGKLCDRFCSKAKVDLDLLKKQVDVAVKLRASYEKAARSCQIALGIVTERAERTAKTTKVKSGEDEFQKFRRQAAGA